MSRNMIPPATPQQSIKKCVWRKLIAFAPAAWAPIVTSKPAYTFIPSALPSIMRAKGLTSFTGWTNPRGVLVRKKEQRCKSCGTMTSGPLGGFSSTRGLVFPKEEDDGWFDSATVGSPRVHRCEPMLGKCIRPIDTHPEDVSRNRVAGRTGEHHPAAAAHPLFSPPVDLRLFGCHGSLLIYYFASLLVMLMYLKYSKLCPTK